MKTIHGGKTKNDKIDSQKTAGRLRRNRSSTPQGSKKPSAMEADANCRDNEQSTNCVKDGVLPARPIEPVVVRHEDARKSEEVQSEESGTPKCGVRSAWSRSPPNPLAATLRPDQGNTPCPGYGASASEAWGAAR